MSNYSRTHNCGELRKKAVGSTVRLSGWVNRRRDHGGLIFIDLRDRFGITQLVFDPTKNPEAHKIAETLRSEWVITVQGEVIPRAEGMANPNMDTGDVEVTIHEITVLSQAKTPPFSICDEELEVNEELRLKYRYLDMRRGKIANRLIVRHQVMQVARQFLTKEGFIEISTPLLGRSTPEGSRDYLVPSRLIPGEFYALPQSPQLYKQILMVAGMDRYFQLCPCLRDEDLRANRQPEFYQIDLEMSFGTPEELFPLIENLMKDIFHTCKGVELSLPLRQMAYDECIEKYGTDKPDLRFDMPLVDIGDIAERSTFTVFKEQLAEGSIVKGLCVKGGSDISRKGIDNYTAFVGQLGIRGLAWMKCSEEGTLTSSIAKFFDEGLQKELKERFSCEAGDLIFMIADQKERTHQALDHLRRRLASDRNLIKPDHHELLWVTDFPLFAWNADEQRIESEHHPFTQPHREDIALLDTDPLKARSTSYDLVLDGHELASGSQRIHDQNIQKKVFAALQISEAEQKQRFGFFLEALSYGTPPHLGIALGFDRIIMVLTGTENIRDVIAFPKTAKASDLMTQCPSPIDKEQLKELSIQTTGQKEVISS